MFLDVYEIQATKSWDKLHVETLCVIRDSQFRGSCGMGKMKGRVIAKSRNSISSRFHLEFRYRSSREKRVDKYRRANFGKSHKVKDESFRRNSRKR